MKWKVILEPGGLQNADAQRQVASQTIDLIKVNTPQMAMNYGFLQLEYWILSGLCSELFLHKVSMPQ